ncbi:fumarylacetoacetate hydrolase family protein [Parerythrobacter aurantius]|uniref:fumarylacetoacetate hydrolase family protein n=1 Tax=Parerythrobacter aurantius TaxID=3127706 RepID=UPI0032435583
MAGRVARLNVNGVATWVVEKVGECRLIVGEFPTTRAFFEHGGPQAIAEGNIGGPVSGSFLSPVTRDARFVCQATNYADHVREVGGNPADIVNNVLFTKASSSISPPDTEIVRPAHVRLLDYEIELGLVLRKRIDGPIEVRSGGLGEWLGGLVIVNDISARDVQISHGQFHKAKSYRTFAPVGPWLVLPTAEEWDAIGSLRLELKVNGEVRQSSAASEMIFDPAATLSEIGTIMDLDAGDLIATGTPGGVALHPPGAFVQALGGFLSPKRRFSAFMKGQLKRAEYLKDGDVIESRIYDPTLGIDLGIQTNRVV